MNKSIIILITLVVFGMGILSLYRDEQYFTMSTCIAEKAEEQNYAGNKYSKEAWQLFANECSN